MEYIYIYIYIYVVKFFRINLFDISIQICVKREIYIQAMHKSTVPQKVFKHQAIFGSGPLRNYKIHRKHFLILSNKS